MQMILRVFCLNFCDFFYFQAAKPNETHAQPPQAFNYKYAQAVIPAVQSITAGLESAHVDAGLALGRSFRVGWGLGGKLVHLGKLCGPKEKT